jgi:hypothetical protein
MIRTHAIRFLLLVVGLAALDVRSARATEEGLPSADQLLQQMLEHSRGAQTTAGRGYYLCTKQTVTDELDSSGQITTRKVKLGESRPNPHETRDAGKWTSQNGFNLDEDLLRRYNFTVVKREILNGRPSFVLTFVPKAPPPPPRKFQDRLLNRAMGTIWLDQQDHELVKASLRLGQPVSFGILGAVDIVTFGFERGRTEEGTWLTKWTDVYFKGRKFVIPLQIRKRVDCTAFRRLDAPTDSPREDRASGR